jgi:hypothetical protein
MSQLYANLHACAEDVLGQHAKLVESLTHPNQFWVSFLAWFVEARWAQNKDRPTGLFYPLRPGLGGAVRAEDAITVSHLLADSMRDAITYKVTAEMVDTMRAVYDDSVKHIQRLDVNEMPSESGFAWLDIPWGIADGQDEACDVRAIGWDYINVMTRSTERGPAEVQPWPCVRLSLWAHTQDDVASGRMEPAVSEDIERKLGCLTLMHTCVVPFNLECGMPDDWTDTAESMLGLVHMLWMFLGMEIVAQHRTIVPRAFRRRALRSIRHGEVHVVVLRRLAHPATGEDVTHREVDWACRWVVQGHWRHWEAPDRPHHAIPVRGDLGERYAHSPECSVIMKERPHRHCLQCNGPLTWVRPYIKGPEGKSLKVSRTLMLLAR